MKNLCVCLLLLPCFLMNSCSSRNSNSGKIHAAVTILPYAGFVKAVGGERVDVRVMIPPGVCLEEFEPLPSKLRQLAGADIYFKVGGPYLAEKSWLEKIPSRGGMKLVDCSEGISLKGENPHLWLGISEAKIIVRNIEKGLISSSPKDSLYFHKNANMFIARIDSVDQCFIKELGIKHRRTLVIYHGAWNYLLSRYSIEELSVEKDGKNPSAGDMRALIERIRNGHLRAVFIEPQSDFRQAAAIADETGSSIERLDPVPEDWVRGMLDLKDKLKLYMD